MCAWKQVGVREIELVFSSRTLLYVIEDVSVSAYVNLFAYESECAMLSRAYRAVHLAQCYGVKACGRALLLSNLPCQEHTTRLPVWKPFTPLPEDVDSGLDWPLYPEDVGHALHLHYTHALGARTPREMAERLRFKALHFSALRLYSFLRRSLTRLCRFFYAAHAL